MFRNNKVSWSPIELEYLAAHKDDVSLQQLSLWLGKSRNAILRKKQELEGKVVPGKKNKNSIIGKRPDLNNIFLRSAWEANVCRWFNLQNWKWFYEPKVFQFAGVKHGTMSYLPDFYLPEQDIYVEVKGHLDGRGRTALRRFKKLYPLEFAKLRAVTGSPSTKATKFFQDIGVPILAFYNELNKVHRKTVEHWE